MKVYGLGQEGDDMGALGLKRKGKVEKRETRLFKACITAGRAQ